MIEYKMLPIERPKDFVPIRRLAGKPKLGAQPERVYYRVLKLSETKQTATICADMNKLDAGELTVRDVSVACLGPNAVYVGDILAYKPLDIQFERPIIAHRYHQQHQHSKHLIAPNER